LAPRGCLARAPFGSATTRRSIRDPLGSEGLTGDPFRWARPSWDPLRSAGGGFGGPHSSAETSARYAPWREGLGEPLKALNQNLQNAIVGMRLKFYAERPPKRPYDRTNPRAGRHALPPLPGTWRKGPSAATQRELPSLMLEGSMRLLTQKGRPSRYARSSGKGYLHFTSMSPRCGREPSEPTPLPSWPLGSPRRCGSLSIHFLWAPSLLPSFPQL
jgi:hypothetical protein